MCETVLIYLDHATGERARAGKHNFFARVQRAIESAGWRVAFMENTLANRLAAPGRDGYALYHMEAPTHDRALTCRRAYVGAFWRIEAQAERWLWPVAQARFDPETIDPQQARGFANPWRKRLYPGVLPQDNGAVLVPLQGRILEQRGFQAASPIDMLRAVLERTDRPVLVVPDPHKRYSAEEDAALRALMREHPWLRFGRVTDDLPTCHMVVTQNSPVAFDGYFLGKPAILFAKTDFHHIAGSVPRDGLDAAFAPRPTPDFDRYLFWFLKQQSINAGHARCEEDILAALRGHGWPI